MRFYLENVDEVLNELKTSREGLSGEEANVRLNNDGKNRLKEEHKKTLLQKIIKSISDPMIIMLLVTCF